MYKRLKSIYNWLNWNIDTNTGKIFFMLSGISLLLSLYLIKNFFLSAIELVAHCVVHYHLDIIPAIIILFVGILSLREALK